jgi:hypothetical protein
VLPYVLHGKIAQRRPTLEGKIESQIARENLQRGAIQRRENMEDAWSGSGLCRPFFKGIR